MMDEFSVGEVAVLYGLVRDARFNERRVKILGPLRSFTGNDGVTDDRYEVDMGEGTKQAHPRNLRKRRPPQEKTTWSECEEFTGWNPLKVVA